MKRQNEVSLTPEALARLYQRTDMSDELSAPLAQQVPAQGAAGLLSEQLAGLMQINVKLYRKRDRGWEICS
jgi:hypothetical protein